MHKKVILLTVIASLTVLASFSSQAPATASAQLVGGLDLQDFHLVSVNEGWVMVGQHLYWTKTGGDDWVDITPPGLDQSTIQAVSFLDVQHGWLVLTNPTESGFPIYTIARTTDSSDTWQTTTLTLFEPGDVDALMDAIYLHFIDAQTGWLVVKRATSSNFSVGTLFRTTDGGETWTRLAIPIGEPVYFVTDKIGWTAGGAAGDELYRTQDGGQTWHPQTVDSSSEHHNRLWFYQLPTFKNAREGTLPVLMTDDGTAEIEFYATDDGGQSWNLATSVPVARDLDPSAHIPLAILDAERSMMIVPGSNQMLNISGRAKRTTVISQNRLATGITNLDMATPDVGWARYASGECASVSLCTQETKLLRTNDGGHTWTALSLPQSIPSSVSDGNLSRPSQSEMLANAPQDTGDLTQTFVGQGFDKCEIATLSQLQNWITNSPYGAVNLYIGGSSRACGNSALGASYLSQLSQQGWKFIPTWVGLQAACSGYGSRMSYDPTTAYNQGVSEANAAVDVATDLGLTLADGSGTIIYYDLENYPTSDTACRNAAKAFMSGWTAQLRTRGNQVGVYGSSCASAIGDFATIDNVPDAVWPAAWYYPGSDPRGVYNPNATVWDVACLSNSLWANHQRIRQYTGGHNETWSGVTLHIDSNVIDGLVANINGDSTPPTTTYTLAGTFDASGWYVSTVQMTLSATDNGSGSGVKLVRYRIDTGSWRTYSAPFTISSDGNHTVYYQAQDNAGNWESEKQFSFKVDVQPPSYPTSVNSGCSAANNVWQNTCNDPNFTWSGASDGPGSGVQDYRYYWGELFDGTPVTYTSDNGFDPPAVPGSVAVRYLRLSTRDNVGHESQPATVFVLRYDASTPTVTVQINDGASTTNQIDVRLNLSAGDTGSGVAEVCVSNSSPCLDWQPYTATFPWTLPALDRRALPVYVWVRDHAGNESAVASDDIFLDLYPPMPHSANYRICADIVDAGGSVGITSTSYSLVFAIGQPWATGGTANTSSSFSGYSGFLSNIIGCLPITRPVTINYTVTQWVVASGGNLRGSTSYRLGDTTGQPAASGSNAFTSTSYVLSSGFWSQITGTVPPTPTISPTPVPVTPTPTPTPGPTPTPQPGGFGISIDDGAPYTNDSVVTVRVWAPNVTRMRFSNDGGYSDDDWRTYQVTSTWVLSTYGDYVRPHYVYAWFRDAGSNVYGSYFDDIIYDPIPPEGRVSVLGGGATTVTLWLEAWDEGSGVDQMRVGEELAGTGTVWLPYGGIPWQAYTNTITWVLQSDTIYVQFQDRAGNLSSIYGSDANVHWLDGHTIYLPLVLRSN